ncbi:MAG: hypothetical protein NTZ24_14990 [Deltaproteobacteria bacterium]|nr:hypothetical protein [Deltaproteobacteria bacterium]
MSDIVIKAETLGKKYVTGHQVENGRYIDYTMGIIDHFIHFPPLETVS